LPGSSKESEPLGQPINPFNRCMIFSRTVSHLDPWSFVAVGG